DHLARELHSCGPEVHPLERRFAERAEPAVKVADLTVKEDSTDHRQQWITDPAVCPRHGPGHDATKESVPHDEVVPLAHLFDKRLDRRKVVTVVRIANDHILSTGRRDPRP